MIGKEIIFVEHHTYDVPGSRYQQRKDVEYHAKVLDKVMVTERIEFRQDEPSGNGGTIAITRYKFISVHKYLVTVNWMTVNSEIKLISPNQIKKVM